MAVASADLTRARVDSEALRAILSGVVWSDLVDDGLWEEVPFIEDILRESPSTLVARYRQRTDRRDELEETIRKLGDPAIRNVSMPYSAVNLAREVQAQVEYLHGDYMPRAAADDLPRLSSWIQHGRAFMESLIECEVPA